MSGMLRILTMYIPEYNLSRLVDDDVDKMKYLPSLQTVTITSSIDDVSHCIPMCVFPGSNSRGCTLP